MTRVLEGHQAMMCPTLLHLKHWRWEPNLQGSLTTPLPLSSFSIGVLLGVTLGGKASLDLLPKVWRLVGTLQSSERRQKIDLDANSQFLARSYASPKVVTPRIIISPNRLAFKPFLNLLSVTTSSSTIRIHFLNSLNFFIYLAIGAMPCFRRSHSSRRELL